MGKKVAEMTQNEQTLYHLKRWGKITSRKAIDVYGITRLADCIYDLRRQGYEISTKDIIVKNRYGKKCRCAEYELLGVTNE